MLRLQVIYSDLDVSKTWKENWGTLFSDAAFGMKVKAPERFFVPVALSAEKLDSSMLKKIMELLITSLGSFSDNKCNLIVYMVTFVRTMLERNRPSKQELGPYFWLTVGLAQLGHPAIFKAALSLMECVLSMAEGAISFKNIDEQFKSLNPDSYAILSSHVKLNPNPDLPNFLCAVLMKGMTDPNTRKLTKNVLTSLLKLSSIPYSSEPGEMQTDNMAFIMILVPGESIEQIFQIAGISTLVNSQSDFNTDQDIDCLLERLLGKFVLQSKNAQLIQLCMLRTLLENSKIEQELSLVIRMIAGMAHKLPEILHQTYA